MNPAVRYCSPGCPSQDRNLDKIVAQLQSAGIDVKVDPQSYPNGPLLACMILREIRSNCGNQKPGAPN